MTPQMRLSPKAWGMILILALIWAGSFLANRAALESIGVYTTVAFRVTGGAIVLWLWIFASGAKVPKQARYLPIFLMHGLLNNALPFTLIVWGQQFIDSGLASILNATTALFTVLLVPIAFADERLTLNRLVGVLIGFAGVVVVIGFDAFRNLNLSALGQWAILGASLSYALSAIISRRTLRGLQPEVASAGMLTGAGLIMIPLALWTDGVPDFAYSGRSIAAVLYLAIMASAVAYRLYYIVLTTAGAGNLSLVTLLIIPFAICLGALVYGETLDWHAYVGFMVLTLGLVVLDGRLPIGKTPKH